MHLLLLLPLLLLRLDPFGCCVGCMDVLGISVCNIQPDDDCVGCGTVDEEVEEDNDE